MENAGTSMYPDVSRVREAPGTTSQAQNPISVVVSDTAIRIYGVLISTRLIVHKL